MALCKLVVIMNESLPYRFLTSSMKRFRGYREKLYKLRFIVNQNNSQSELPDKVQ
jgi:hypothetical protein